MKYHYEYEVRTNNLCWGSLKIGVFRLRSDAICAGESSNRGVYTIKKIRVYEKERKFK